MKKIIQWLSGGVIKEIGNVIDKLTTTDEERLEVKKQIQQILEDADTKAQVEVSKRWEADMKSDSWLSKNVRPLVLIFLVISTVLLIFIDAGAINFIVEAKWTDLLQLVLITVIGAYFGGRTLEKKIKK